jgi:UDP-N-acetylmuramate--alanine ligase
MAMRRIKREEKQLRLWPAGKSAAAVAARPLVPPKWTGCRVHLMGIGGIGMSGIARLLQALGCEVSGCDSSRSDITDALAQRGVPVSIGHSPGHVQEGADLLVMSAAIRETNPELREARRRGVSVVKYAEALGWLMKERDGIAVSGSHGKTTTTSMIAYALSYAGLNPAMLVGGLVPQLGGNARPSRKGPFVVEACEYDRSFLNLTPKAAIITNVDRDHLDYYSGIDDLVDAFGAFAERTARDGVVLVNGDDPNAMKAAERAVARVETFGEGEDCAWRVPEWTRADGHTRFRAYHKGRNIGVFDLLAPGFYNVRNALACIAACGFFGANRQEVRESLAEFRGARRRFDRLGEADGVLVLDDYGHHPTEVRVTLDALRQEYPSRRVWCVFQPHQCSRTRLLLNEFAGAFGSADRVIVPDIYSVRDSRADQRRIHSRDLVQELRRNGVEAEYGAEFRITMDRLLASVRRGDLVMTMGAGPVDELARGLLVELKKRESRDAVVLRT